MATETGKWATVAVLAGRLIFTLLFVMAATFKFLDIGATAQQIEAAGFPLPLLLAWLAAFFELALIAGFVTGAWFSEVCLAAMVYVLFLGVFFHGPSRWEASQAEFGFFVDHFTFAAGLLFAAAYGPGKILAMQRGWLRR